MFVQVYSLFIIEDFGTNLLNKNWGLAGLTLVKRLSNSCSSSLISLLNFKGILPVAVLLQEGLETIGGSCSSNGEQGMNVKLTILVNFVWQYLILKLIALLKYLYAFESKRSVKLISKLGFPWNEVGKGFHSSVNVWNSQL